MVFSAQHESSVGSNTPSQGAALSLKHSAICARERVSARGLRTSAAGEMLVLLLRVPGTLLLRIFRS